METDEPSSVPRKKIKLDDGSSADMEDIAQPMVPHNSFATGQSHSGVSTRPLTHDDAQKEYGVGIVQLVHPESTRFEGILKQRYTDFLVNEIQPDGRIVHLDSFTVPRFSGEEPSGKVPAGGVSIEESTTGVVDEPNAGLVAPQSHQAPSDPSKATGSLHSKPTTGVDTSHPDSTVACTTQEPNAANGKPEAELNPDMAKWRDYAEKHEAFVLLDEDRSALEKSLGPAVTNEALALFNRVMDSPNRKPSQYGIVRSEAAIDRDSRTQLHQDVRRIFASRLESSTESDGIFVIKATNFNSARLFRQTGNGRGGHAEANGNRNQRERGPYVSTRDKFARLGGDFLHFSLYKENKDTMEVVSFVARQVHVQPKAFQFAGTKDRRAVTVQRVSAYRLTAHQLLGLNKKLRGSKLGNFSYAPNGLTLGDLSGNEFVISLRDCQFPGMQGLSHQDQAKHAEAIVKAAVDNLAQDGFLNYYGLQRFGTFSIRTDTVGVKLLQGDYEGAVDIILHIDPVILAAAQTPTSDDPLFSSDDRARALAVDTFRQTGKSGPALDQLPRKYSAEFNVIRSLGSKNGSRNFITAIQAIPRNLRLMYVHAYQSLVWNHAASHRWSKAGSTVLAGDLVLVSEHKDKTNSEEFEEPDVDEDGEPIVRPKEEDRALAEDERFERARALTQEEVDSGLYSVFDVVLPTPGYDIIYPSHMAAFYEKLMGSEEFGGLDPHNMRRPVRDLSLSGNYRKLLARPLGKCEYRIVQYTNELEQFAKTDLDRLAEATKQGRPTHRAREQAPRPPATWASASGLSKNLLDMGLDGAMESKIEAIKESLFGSGEEGPNETSVDVEHTPATEESTTGETTTADSAAVDVDNDSTAPADSTAVPSEAAPSMTVDATSHETPPKIGVVLTLQLGVSTYATMALRELAQGGIASYKAEYGGGR